MLKRLKTVRRKKDKSKCGVSAGASEVELGSSSEVKGIRRSKSIAEIEFKNEKKCHKRTKSSEQSCQTDAHLYIDDDPKKIEIGEKRNHSTIPQPPQLHPAYISVLLILVGFNFAAFLSYYVNSTIAFYRMGLSLLSGILVALFLRKFIGLNLFKTQDKVSERAVLTIVTQIRLVYKFIMADYDNDSDMDEFIWSFFLFNLSIWILFLDKITFNLSPVTAVFKPVLRLPKLY